MNDQLHPEFVSTTALAQELNAHLSRCLPWLPTRPDFSKTESRHLDWAQADDRTVEEFLRSTPLWNYPFLALLHSEREPVRFFKMPDAARRLDEATFPHEILVVFGADNADGDWKVSKDYFGYVHAGRDIWVCHV